MPKPEKKADAVKMGAEVRAIREERDLTQDQVAVRFGVHLETYRSYERGRASLKAAALPRLADSLTVSRTELVQRLGLIEKGGTVDRSVLERAVQQFARTLGIDLSAVARARATIDMQVIPSNEAGSKP